MSENCGSKDCPLVSRVAALERENQRHTETHKEIFQRLNELETQTAVQENKLDTIMKKLDTITEKLEALEAKPGKRWDKLAETTLVVIATAVVAFLLGRVGL